MKALRLLCLRCIAVVYHCTDCFLHVGLMNDYRTAMNLYMYRKDFYSLSCFTHVLRLQ